jgi:hypothetical protein
MLILDPEFFSIPDPESNNNKRGGEEINCFFCGYKFHKIQNYWIFFSGEEKDSSQLTKNLSIFNPKSVTKLSEIIESRTQGLKKHRNPNSDPQHTF